MNSAWACFKDVLVFVTTHFLGMADNDRTVLTIHANLQVGGLIDNVRYPWGRPGSPVASGVNAITEGASGRLRYTLYDKAGSYKITVETTEDEEYTDGALSVEIMNINAGGSDISTIGVPVFGYVPIIFNDPKDLITGIDGNNTWTGTYRSDGPWVRYRLDKHPGNVSGSKLPVLYTLVPEDSE
jgi:hypothetical protein